MLAKGPYPQSGVVLMVHDSAAKWGVFRPDGSPLSVSGTTTQGLQEAIDYAQKRALPLFVIGGGITPPHTGLPTPSRALSQINCSTPIAVPTGWVNSYHFFGVNLLYDVAHGADPARDFITFDSADMMDWDMHTSQIIYPGNGAAIRFLPAHDNGEDFAGFTGSRFLFGSIAITHATTLRRSPRMARASGSRCRHWGSGFPTVMGFSTPARFTRTRSTVVCMEYGSTHPVLVMSSRETGSLPKPFTVKERHRLRLARRRSRVPSMGIVGIFWWVRSQGQLGCQPGEVRHFPEQVGRRPIFTRGNQWSQRHRLQCQRGEQSGPGGHDLHRRWLPVCQPCNVPNQRGGGYSASCGQRDRGHRVSLRLPEQEHEADDGRNHFRHGFGSRDER